MVILLWGLGEAGVTALSWRWEDTFLEFSFYRGLSGRQAFSARMVYPLNHLVGLYFLE